jgi:hypothetical protein
MRRKNNSAAKPFHELDIHDRLAEAELYDLMAFALRSALSPSIFYA